MKATLVTVALLLVACAEQGQPAIEREEWLLALERARDNGLLDDSCIDDGVTYELLSDEEWKERGHDMKIGGITDEQGHVEARAGGVDRFSVHFVLEHEFLHAILECSGYGHFQNIAHLGPVWNGLRGDDPGDR